jgi:hypothetical protein
MASKLVSPFFSFTIHKLIFFFLGLVLWLLLDFGYQNLLHKYFIQDGFSLNITPKYWEALLLYLILVCSAPKVFNKPSDFFMNIFLFLYIAPLLVFYGLTDQQRSYLYIILMGYLIIDIIRRRKRFHFPLLKRGIQSAFFLVILGILLTTVWLIFLALTGTVDLNFNINEVYKFREKSDDIIDANLMGYVNSWAYKVFGPSLLILVLYKKQYFWVIAILLLYFFWFSVINHKIILFIPALIIFIFYFFLKNKNLSVFPLLLIILISICFLAYYIFDFIWMTNLFFRRAFFVPSFLTFTYYEFFSTHEFIYWSHSFLSRLIDYPFYLNPPKLISDYLGDDSHANNSFLSTGYMNAGILGIIVYSIIVGFLFRIIDSLSFSIPRVISVSIVIVPIISLITSADLPAAIMTHGIAIAILILILLRSKINYIYKPIF